MTQYSTSPEGAAYPIIDVSYIEHFPAEIVAIGRAPVREASAQVAPYAAAPEAPEASPTAPSLAERLIEMVGSGHYAALDGYIAEARKGELVTIYGTSGFFAASGKDRQSLDRYFREIGLIKGWHVADSISRYGGPSITARAYHTGSEREDSYLAELLCSGRAFAITGTYEEIKNNRRDADPTQYNQIWVPQSDAHGRLPLYLRLTGPQQDARGRDSSYLEQDWVLLPHLTVPVARASTR